MATNNHTVRDGIVDVVYPDKMAARVIFPDSDNTPSAILPICTQGSRQTKLFWLPVPGESVVCIMKQNNTTSLNQGFIIGSYFNDEDIPPENSGDGIRMLDFGDGTTIKYDRGSKELSINCAGGVKINGTRIDLNT